MSGYFARPLPPTATVGTVALLLLHCCPPSAAALGEGAAPVMLVDIGGDAVESAGQVAILYNGSWGWVCQPAWEHGQVVAEVVCGQMGFVDGGRMWGEWPARRLQSQSGFTSEGEWIATEVERAWMRAISCNGTEGALSECQHADWGVVPDSCVGMSVTCFGSRTETATTSTTLSSTLSSTTTSSLSATGTSATTLEMATVAGTISVTAEASLAGHVGWLARELLAEAFGVMEEQISTAWEAGVASANSTTEVSAATGVASTSSWTTTDTSHSWSSSTMASTTTAISTSTAMPLRRRLEVLLLLQRYEVPLPAQQAAGRLMAFDPELAADSLQVQLAQLDMEVSDVVFSQPFIVGETTSSTITEPMTSTHESLPDLVDPDELIGRLRQHEEDLIGDLLSSNASRAEARVPEGAISVLRVSVQEIPAGGSVTVAVRGTSAEVAVPATVFSQLSLEDAIVVVTALSAASSMAGVRAAVNLNIVSTATGEYVSVWGLADPVAVQMPANRSQGVECSWWDEQESLWSREGFVREEQPSDSDWLVCYTTHFTLFGAIVDGFVGSLECSQATLLSADALGELMSGDWYVQLPTVLLWLALALLAALMAIACYLDVRRARGELWDDEHFLISEGRATGACRESPAQLVDEVNEPQPSTGEDDSQASSSRSGIVRACGLKLCACALLPWRCLVWCWGLDAVREAVDDLMENIVEYEFFGEARAMFRGLRQSMAADAAQGGRFLALLSSAMSTIMVRNAQLHAGAELRVAHADVSFVTNDETVRDMLVMVAVTDDGVEDSKRATTGAGGHVLRVKTDARSSDLQVKRALKLTQLHQAVAEQVNAHLPRHSTWSSLPGMASVLFQMCSPVGSVLVPSIFSTSSMRALLLTCKAIGAVLIVTLFFDAAGDIPSKYSSAECADVDGVGGRIGRLLAVGVGSALLACIPVSLLASLHRRRFKRFPSEGCPEWNRQLRAWRVQDRAIWILGTSYIVFGVLFICLFLANVERGSLSEWLVTATLTILQDTLLVPIVLAVCGPLFAMGALAVVSCSQRVERGQVIRDHVGGSWRLEGLVADRSPNGGASASADLDPVDDNEVAPTDHRTTVEAPREGGGDGGRSSSATVAIPAAVRQVAREDDEGGAARTQGQLKKRGTAGSVVSV